MPRLMPMIRHRITLLLAAIVILIGTLHLATPLLIRSLALHWLKEHGAQHAEIDRVRVNPWLGRLTVEGLTEGSGISVGQAVIDIDWWPLWHHRIDLRALHLERMHLRLVQQADGSWAPAGLRLPPSAPSKHPWQVILHDISLNQVRIALAGRTLKADIPIKQMTLTLASMSQAGAQVLNASLAFGAGDVDVGGTRATAAALSLRGQLMLPAREDEAPGTRHLIIQGQDLKLQLGREQMALSVAKAAATGIATEAGDTDAQGTRLTVTDLDLNGIHASAANGLDLASVRALKLHGLALSGTHRLSFSRLALQDIGLPAAAGQSLGHVEAITVGKTEIAADALHLDSLALQGMDLTLLHHRKGLAVIDRLKAMAASPSASAAKGDAKARAEPIPTLRIDHASIDDTSRITLRDAAIDPPFVTHLKVETFKLAAFDTQGNAPSSLDAALRLGDEGKLTAKGSFRLHDGLQAADMTLVVRRLSMPPLSGYTERDFGDAIQTGQMDLDSRVRVHDKTVQAQNKLVVRNLALKTMPQAGKATQALGMPLGMAADILRNDRGDITLDVPVSGRLDDPNVHLSDAFDQALATAMRSAALSSASLLLQPYGSILPAISMAAGVISHISKPRLTPIAFSPHIETLSEQARAYVAKIAELLKKKNSFRLQVCGIAGRDDFLAGASGPPKPGSAERNRLLALATSRSSQVIKALVAEGISADRLFSCRPDIDAGASNGRVELLLQ